jgi:hypothetical protein
MKTTDLVFQAYAAVEKRFLLFWDFTQRKLFVAERRRETVIWYY